MKIVSYNIRKAIGRDRRRRPARILQVLNDIAGDVVILQEADLRLGARPSALPRNLIERETDYVVAELGTDVSLGWHGNAVLVRRGLPIKATEQFELPGLEPRGAVMVSVAGLVLVGAHLGLLRVWRQRQMNAILQHLGDHRDHALVAGDFNEWSGSAGFEPWEGRLNVVSPGFSFHSARPIARLDRFAHGPSLRIAKMGVVRDGAARLASDHLPVWAQVETVDAVKE